MQITNFHAALLASGYSYLPQTGVYCKDDLNANCHVYNPDPENIGDSRAWEYILYSYELQVLHRATFTI